MKFTKVSFFIGIRYFFAKKKDAFVSLNSIIATLGILVGVASLIIVMSVMNGFRKEFDNSFLGINSELTIHSVNNVISDYNSVRAKVNQFSFVKTAVPIMSGQAFVSGKKGNSGCIIQGIDFNDIDTKYKINDNLVFSTRELHDKDNVVILGNELAIQLGVTIDDTISLVSNKTHASIFGDIPNTKTLTVVGIFSTGINEYDNVTIFVPLQVAQKFFSFGKENVNLFEVRVNNQKKLNEYKNVLNEILRADKLYVNDWLSQNSNFLELLQIERVSMFVILCIIILVASLNIISTLLMSVKDKMKEIAILRTLGVSRGEIVGIFVINGMMIGILGTFLGLIFGVLVASNIKNIELFLYKFSHIDFVSYLTGFLHHFPSDVHIYDIIVTCIFTLVLSFFASIYPAYRAASLNPVKIIRYE